MLFMLVLHNQIAALWCGESPRKYKLDKLAASTEGIAHKAQKVFSLDEIVQEIDLILQCRHS